MIVPITMTITIAPYRMIGISSESSASLKETSSDSVPADWPRSSDKVLNFGRIKGLQFKDFAPEEFAYHVVGISFDSPGAKVTYRVVTSANSSPSKHCILVDTSTSPVLEAVTITPIPLLAVPLLSSGTTESITTYGSGMLAVNDGVTGAGSRVVE